VSGVAVFGVNGVEEFETVAVVKPEAARGIRINQARQIRGRRSEIGLLTSDF
jgi:hypothetical protein